MFEAEADRLREVLLEAGEISPLLNLGSSTRAFREERKPHIERALFAPLRRAGVRVVHCDLKPDEGVDVAGDILEPAVHTKLAGMGFRCVLLANLLEHVGDRAAVIRACTDLAGPDGLILATVPQSFPYHADPLDSGYRPEPAELAAAFPGTQVLASETVRGPTYREQLRRDGTPPWRALLRTLLWLLAAPVRPNSARARLSRWRWYRRPYLTSLVLLRVNAAQTAS